MAWPWQIWEKKHTAKSPFSFFSFTEGLQEGATPSDVAGSNLEQKISVTCFPITHLINCIGQSLNLQDMCTLVRNVENGWEASKWAQKGHSSQPIWLVFLSLENHHGEILTPHPAMPGIKTQNLSASRVVKSSAHLAWTRELQIFLVKYN